MTQELRLQEVERKLKAELARLQERLSENARGDSQPDDANLDRSDLANDFARRERRLALRDVEEAHLGQIMNALQRVADGTYGKCAQCGETIPPGRLEIIPYATMCVSCQQEQDQE